MRILPLKWILFDVRNSPSSQSLPWSIPRRDVKVPFIQPDPVSSLLYTKLLPPSPSIQAIPLLLKVTCTTSSQFLLVLYSQHSLFLVIHPLLILHTSLNHFNAFTSISDSVALLSKPCLAVCISYQLRFVLSEVRI